MAMYKIVKNTKTLTKSHYLDRTISSSITNHLRYLQSAAASQSSPSSSSSSSSSSQSQLQPKELKKGKWSKLMLFIPGALTFGLGSWQIFRRRDKVEMLEYRQKRLEMEPFKWTKVSSSSEKPDSLEFRRILCKGVFDENRSIFVGPRSRSISGVTENGYYLITPLVPVPDDPESWGFIIKNEYCHDAIVGMRVFLSSCSTPLPILVNRGWVPRTWRDKSIKASKEDEKPSNESPPPNQDNGSSSWKFWSRKPKIVEDKTVALTPIEVIGVVRESENPSIFVPANEPNSFQWFYVDVPAIARAFGLPEDTVYIEDINEKVNVSKPYPLPKDANTLICSSVMPQDHLRYTLTWYSLSAGVTFMAYKRIMPRKSRR